MSSDSSKAEEGEEEVMVMRRWQLKRWHSAINGVWWIQKTRKFLDWIRLCFDQKPRSFLQFREIARKK
jgi:hypothetical protein